MTLRDILEGAEFQPQSYSGRFMYGAHCLGVTVNDLGAFFSTVVESIRCSGPEVHDTVSKAFRGMKTDNLGRFTVVYFPDIPWE